jgi:hypothetical protein
MSLWEFTQLGSFLFAVPFLVVMILAIAWGQT